MLLSVLSALLFVTFSVLGGFHFFWLFGGNWGLESVIPTKEKGQKSPAIPKFATLIVAVVLTAFGLIYLANIKSVSIVLPELVTNSGFWLIPSVFILRAVGDFNYLGFFKKIKNTEFAKADSKIFAPLCLIIGLIGMTIQLLKIN